MNRHAKTRGKWLAGALLALASGGCITYSGDYADDGYYSSPDRGSVYNNGYYGDYYYSAVPTISISYSLFFGYPFYGYGGCGYWSPYCGLFYPGYGYGYGPGYGFGLGHGPYYGHQPHHHHKPKPKPRPPYEQPTIPDSGMASPIVERPLRAVPEDSIRARTQWRSRSVTRPVSTGNTAVAIAAAPPPVTNAVPKTTLWRIPANQRQDAPMAGRGNVPAQRLRTQPEIPSPQPVRREYVRLDADEPPVTRVPVRGSEPVRANRQSPAVEAVQDVAPERTPRTVVREPKPVREKPTRKASATEDADPGF